jgi:hypothetical protein
VCGVCRNNSDELSTPDVLIARSAARQHGVVTVAQLLAAGLDRRAIAYRRRVRRLHLLHRGVYAVGHRPPSPLATAMAAVLACGPEAVLSHRSAAALWRIVPRWPSPTEVARTDRRQSGTHVHRSRHADATTHYGIRVTTPARTLVDLADVLNSRQLTRALNEAQVQRLVTPAELTTLLTRYPGRRTSQLTPERGATRSHLEDTFTRFLKHHRLPLPERNQQIAGAVYRDRNSRSDSTAASSTPPHGPSSKTATAMPTSSMRGSPRSASPTKRLKRHASHEAHRLKEILRSRGP